MTSTTKNTGAKVKRKSAFRVVPKSKSVYKDYQDGVQLILSDNDNSSQPILLNQDDVVIDSVALNKVDEQDINNKSESQEQNENDLLDAFVSELKPLLVKQIDDLKNLSSDSIVFSKIELESLDSVKLSEFKESNIDIVLSEPENNSRDQVNESILISEVDRDESSKLFNQDNVNQDNVKKQPEFKVKSKTSNVKKGSSIKVAVKEKSFSPIIVKAVLPFFSQVEKTTTAKVEEKVNDVLIKVGIPVFILPILLNGKISKLLASNLGVAINSKPLAGCMLNDYSYGLFLKSVPQLYGVDVREARAPKIFYFSRALIHKSTIIAETLDSSVGFVKFAYEPSANNFGGLALKLNDFYSIYQGANVYSATIATGNFAYNLYQEEYSQAFNQALVISASFLVSKMMNADPNVGGNHYGALAIVAAGSGFAINSYSATYKYVADSAYINMKTAYKDVCNLLSLTPAQNLYDFASLKTQYEADVNDAKLNLELQNMEQFLNTKGEIGKKTFEMIYAPIIKEKYDLLNKVVHGEITQEQADALQTRHVSVTLERQSYDNCIELKNVSENSQQYHCYNLEQEELYNIIIGSNGQAVVTDL